MEGTAYVLVSELTRWQQDDGSHLIVLDVDNGDRDDR